MKTPEEYVVEHIFQDQEDAGKEQTSAEKAFVQKYLGIGLEEAKEKIVSVSEDQADELSTGIRKQPAPDTPAPDTAAPGTDQRQKTDVAPDVSRKELLRQEPVIQFVSFMVAGQEFTLPIKEVQEVIRYVEPTKIPTAPEYILGMINLRGSVTPLVSLEHLVEQQDDIPGENNFVVICKVGDLQIGLVIHAVKTMYYIDQKDIEWNLEAKFGASSELLAGLFHRDGKIIGIIALDWLSSIVLK